MQLRRIIYRLMLSLCSLLRKLLFSLIIRCNGKYFEDIYTWTGEGFCWRMNQMKHGCALLRQFLTELIPFTNGSMKSWHMIFYTLKLEAPSVSNHAWFSKDKYKKIASSYTLWPHEYAYIQCCWGSCRCPNESTATSPWEANKHYELESQYILTICPCGYSLARWKKELCSSHDG